MNNIGIGQEMCAQRSILWPNTQIISLSHEHKYDDLCTMWVNWQWANVCSHRILDEIKLKLKYKLLMMINLLISELWFVAHPHNDTFINSNVRIFHSFYSFISCTISLCFSQKILFRFEFNWISVTMAFIRHMFHDIISIQCQL